MVDTSINSESEILTVPADDDDDQVEVCEAGSRFSPGGPLYRFTGLMLMCLLGFGKYSLYWDISYGFAWVCC